MLTRLLKSTFSRSPAEPAVPASSQQPASSQPSPPQPAAPQAISPQPVPFQHAWQALAVEAGVQSEAYPDNPRLDVHHLFAHPPRRVLDIGCASGAVGQGIKETFPGSWVWGCELNPHTAALAADRLDHMSTEPIESWGATDLELLRGVDTVMLLDVLEHMYNPWAQLQFLARHLADDTQVIVSLPNVGHLAVLERLAQGEFPYAAEGILDVTHIRFFTLGEMLAMFQQTGFATQRGIVLPGELPAPPAPQQFPYQLTAGKVSVRVDNAQEWLNLHTVQFGFRLVPVRAQPQPA
jgi:2-polyprenyl-3-methyl-5-hydroxy-6-metoxy-1,4-benzoquinol methylase